VTGVPVDERRTPAPRVAIFGDFVCPWSFLASDYLERIEAEYGYRGRWRPHWLRPDLPPEGAPLPVDAGRRQMLERWIEEVAPEHAAHMTFPTKLQFSFRAFEALELAEREGRGPAFAKAVFQELWCSGKDIGEIATLQDAGERAGLDPDVVRDVLVEHTFLADAVQAVQEARAIGIKATPTMFIGTARIDGWHYYEVVQSVFERLGLGPKNASPPGDR
jgi:predicted DsbA family dithiol-disulfide isomerase